MSIFFHMIIAASYVVVALAVAVGLPHGFPAVDLRLSVIVGGIVLVAGVLLHEMFFRREREREMGGEILALRNAHNAVMDEVLLARGEAKRIFDAFQEANTGGAKKARRDIENVISEVRVLQTLVEQFAVDRAALEDRADTRANTGVRTPRDRQASAETAPDGRQLMPPVAQGLADEDVLDIVRRALRRDSIDLFLQPIVSLPSRNRKFYESYSRIRAEDGSMVLPDQYIAIAEREGLITAIDNMLLFRCVQLVRRSQRRKYNVGFFCNISAHTLADEKFFAQFIDFMEHNADLAPHLFFEFGQADLARHDWYAAGDVGRLGELGFRFSMDQVDSLILDPDYLRDRNFRFVKIRAADLLATLESDATGFDIREFKNGLSAAGIDVIVEKIETEQMVAGLLDYGIEFGQGFLFGEPRLSRDA